MWMAQPILHLQVMPFSFTFPLIMFLMAVMAGILRLQFLLLGLFTAGQSFRVRLRLLRGAAVMLFAGLQAYTRVFRVMFCSAFLALSGRGRRVLTLLMFSIPQLILAT